jgi:hypothetical protein
MYRYLLATLAQNAGFILENIGTTGSGTFLQTYLISKRSTEIQGLQNRIRIASIPKIYLEKRKLI